MSENFEGGNKLELYTNLREGEKGAWISICTYLVLSCIKLIIGYHRYFPSVKSRWTQ